VFIDALPVGILQVVFAACFNIFTNALLYLIVMIVDVSCWFCLQAADG
jgi:hypothetical protein